MEFNTKKCKVMVFNGPSFGLHFTMYNEELSIVDFYEYLGFVISSKNQTNLYLSHFKNALEKAEKRLHCISHYGFYRDGLRPETAIKLYKLMVRPILEYGSQVISYQKYYLQSSNHAQKDLCGLTTIENKLEQFQTKALKTLIGCSKSSSPVVVRLFSGVEPLKGRLDMLKLRYFWKVAHTNDQSIAHRVFKHRKEQFLSTKYGFIHEAFNLCCKYDVIDFWHGKLKGLTNPASFIKKKIIAFSLKKDLDIARKRPCAFTDIFLSNIFSYQKSYHLVEPYIIQDFFSSAAARCLVQNFC